MVVGVIPRTASHLMQLVGQSDVGTGCQHRVYFSYLEIYNEKVYDLLDTSQGPLHIREDHERNIFIPNLTQVSTIMDHDFEAALVD
jgi:hypothetical protein